MMNLKIYRQVQPNETPVRIHLLIIQRPHSSFHLLLLQAFHHHLVFVIHLVLQI